MKSLRLFVAAYPPSEITSALLEYARSHLPRDDRLTTPSQVHLTLLFLGNVRFNDVETICESMDRAASGRDSCELVIDAVQCLPQSGEARLLAAIGQASGNLLELQRRLASRLSTIRPKASRDTFTPHLTLARLQPGTPRFAGGVIAPIRWGLSSVRLMRSDLQPSGAMHTVVHEALLDL